MFVCRKIQNNQSSMTGTCRSLFIITSMCEACLLTLHRLESNTGIGILSLLVPMDKKRSSTTSLVKIHTRVIKSNSKRRKWECSSDFCQVASIPQQLPTQKLFLNKPWGISWQEKINKNKWEKQSCKLSTIFVLCLFVKQFFKQLLFLGLVPCRAGLKTPFTWWSCQSTHARCLCVCAHLHSAHSCFHHSAHMVW